MILRGYLIVLVLVVALLTSCVAPPPRAPAPTPTPTPTLPAIPPEEILASHFGIDGPPRDFFEEIARLGIRWGRCRAPFVWGIVEPERGKYIWQRTDGAVQGHQAYNFGILAVIWPFAEWDQANWGTAPAATGPMIDEEFLGRTRRKPYDMDAYRRFVSALVERYDGDGIDDMPGLRYPIKYWEAMLTPSLERTGLEGGYWTTFNGSPEDYLEVLKATYQAVKEADPEAKVLHGCMATMWPQQVSFWEPVFEKGSQYFDIANIQPVTLISEVEVAEFKELLSKYGIDKLIWVTQAEYYVTRCASPEEHGQSFAKIYVVCFASGVDKFFYSSFAAPYYFQKQQTEHRMQDSALIDVNGEKRPAYYGLKTLIEKLDKFTSAEKLAEGQYRFIVEGKTIYVLWGSGEIPEEITGEVLVTDIYGKETRTDSSAIKLTESPIFVEGSR